MLIGHSKKTQCCLRMIFVIILSNVYLFSSVYKHFVGEIYFAQQPCLYPALTCGRQYDNHLFVSQPTMWNDILQFTKTSFFNPCMSCTVTFGILKLILTTWGQLWYVMEVTELCLQLWYNTCSWWTLYSHSAERYTVSHNCIENQEIVESCP